MEPTAQQPYKRQLRSVLIHRPMQREFALIIISLLFISSLTIGFVIHYTIHQAMMGGYRFGRVSPYEVMSDLSYDLVIRITLVLFVTMFIIVLFGIFFLHRIAGPVYRFRTILRRISKGEIPEEIRLREGDFFTETADDLNYVLRLVRERRERIQNLQKNLEQEIQKNASIPSVTILEELKRALDKLA